MFNTELENMKKLIYILLITPFIISCSKDDNDLKLTFLEKYKETVWTLNEYESESYIRFINNINQPFESWLNLTDCYYYELETLNYGDGSPLPHEITENSGDMLEISYYSYWDGNVYHEVEKYTLTVTGNSLKIERRFYEDGDLQNVDEPVFLKKTTDDVDNLTLCEYD